jgi:UDP-N-acetylmuramoyl-tripeptide--D-alanyl-D-alanine ligase
MMGYCIEQLAEIVGGRLRLADMPPLGGLWEPTGRVVVGLSAVREGDVLLALPDCIASNPCCADLAFSRGALGVIAAGRSIEPWAGKFSIQVDDAGWALWTLARAARQQFDGRVIAVAGHVGKSTTMAMIDAVLGVDRSGCGMESTVSDKLALPTQMLALRDDADYALFELHAQAKGELDTAAHLACPHLAVATAIEPNLLGDDAHELLAAAPQFLDELFSALPDDGCAIASGDAVGQPCQRLGQARCLTYGRSPQCDVQATHVLASDSALTFVVGGQLARINVWGRHPLQSALAAWAVGRACGVGEAEIATRLTKFEPLPHRCRASLVGNIMWIDDAAGRSPVAVRAALALLQRTTTAGKRIAVCGELSPSLASEKAYRRLGRDCVTVGGADVVVAIGSGASAIAAGAYEYGMANSSCVTCDSPVNALCELRALIAPGDAVVATAVAPSLADALVASFQHIQQRSAA